MGLLASAMVAVTLTVHPGQTLHVARLHPGDVFVCRTAGDAVRWKATLANLHATSFVWDKRLQLNITPRGGKTTVSCQLR
jgi:hypothetical protein